ncbi:hypothetical protein ccbrp13_47610 [Ktedonobacteria bacterium brp13]|nr:hypothetical protein ccbrp13_47610 [Ktedonobacteria bacterium brp13]
MVCIQLKLFRRVRPVRLFLVEAALILLLTTLSTCLRVIAAFHTGTEVDEPIYRFAAAYYLHHGFPAVRPALSEPVIPFLYHPPFALMLLGEWFRLWGSETLLTGRMLSILCSGIVLILLYLFLLRAAGRAVAIVACLLIAIDPWLIFTNQAVYLENSQMLFCVFFAWSYWFACESDSGRERERLGRYLLAGIFLGCAIIWKHIGGFLLISVLAQYLLQRRHLRGHLLLLGVALLIMACYVFAMHCWFGAIYDNATMVQIDRTFWDRYSPGLNYSPWDAVQVIYTRYYIFPITILVLVGGALLTTVCYYKYLFKKRPLTSGNTTVLTWALGGIIFAVVSSLKSPHYMVLWLIPLYVLIAIEGVPFVLRLTRPAFRQRRAVLLMRSGLICCILLLVLTNMWSFRMRFLNPFGNTLALADSYINEHIPDDSIIITQDYFGVDILPRYINIAGITRVDQIISTSASYVALYWSTTEPLPETLQTINSRCSKMATFTGFKDHVEICKLYKGTVASMLSASVHVARIVLTRRRHHQPGQNPIVLALKKIISQSPWSLFNHGDHYTSRHQHARQTRHTHHIHSGRTLHGTSWTHHMKGIATPVPTVVPVPFGPPIPTVVPVPVATPIPTLVPIPIGPLEPMVTPIPTVMVEPTSPSILIPTGS